jgi:hypothetical protein
MTVRKKPDPTPPATEKQLRAALETLRQESAATRQRVLRLLAEGQNTGELRMELTALERRIEDIAAVLAGFATQRERAEATHAASEADALATDALHRLEARLAGLQPPPRPTIKELEP